MKIGKMMMLIAALTLTWGCSSDDDDQLESSTFVIAEKPSWAVNMVGNDDAPNWQAPDPGNYESSMIIMVRLEEQLEAFSSDEDRMTVFIGDECRAKPAVPQKDDANCYFVLKIDGNGSDRDVSFSLFYYSARLHHLFKLSGKETFASDRTYGIEQEFIPPFITKGNSKYPVQCGLTVNLPENAPFTVNEGDRVAVFVGDECRGCGTVGNPITVFLTSANETLQVRYYSVEKGGIYTLKKTVTPTLGEDQNITITF